MEKFLREQKEMRKCMEKKLSEITLEYEPDMDASERKHFELAKHYTYSLVVGESLMCEWHFTEMAKHYQTMLPQKVERELRTGLNECVNSVRNSDNRSV
ncbi:hypothetical protein [Flavobacterium sp.]|uniref:hypothetical protein n=1 Tax=Flavobacterium sp. TaxID=239 RepID=UPI00121E67F0|nr:hypothetical protein [Flavobacterium sp.]RZJ70396.1 MAG: hypothetical protein EOO49_14035 [Flavobacterium sp.]